MWNDFWTGSGGVPGDFSYKTVHILSIIFVVLLSALLIYKGRKTNDTNKRKTIIIISILALCFEVFWRILYISQKTPKIELYPFYPCNLAGIIVPLIALSNNKTLKEVFYAFAFIGGVITFAMPDDIFTNQHLNFPILKSVLQHTAIIIIPVFEYFTYMFKPKFKNFYLTIGGMFIHLVNSEFIPKLFGLYGTDYIFLRSGLPFIIPNVPGWLTISVFGIFVVIVFYAIIDLKGFKALFKKSKLR